MCEVSVLLDYLPRGVARRAPELQHVPAQLVRQAENVGDDWVGGGRRATTGSGAVAEDQAPQPQHVFAGLPSIISPLAARRVDAKDELHKNAKILVFPQFRLSLLGAGRDDGLAVRRLFVLLRPAAGRVG